MLKRFFALIFLTLFLCGCSKTTQEEVVFSSWGSVTETRILNKIIKEFEAENPQIKVKFMHIPQNYFQKLHLLFASNTPPDVLFINNLYLPVYENHLLDLSDKVDLKAFYPQALDGLSSNGKILAFPRDISNLVFYVNTDKIELPKQNLTIYELLELAKKSSTDKVFALSHENETFWAMPYLRVFGGGVLDEELNLIINSKESAQGIDFYKNLVEEYKVSPSESQVGSLTQAQMFLDGKILFYLSGRWMYPIISEKASFSWQVIPFPEGKLPQLCDTSGWAISKNSKHQEASLRLVEFLSSKEGSEYFTNTGLIVPARIDVSKKLNNTAHNEKVFVEIIKNSQKTPVNKNYRKLLDEVDLIFLNK